MKHFNSISHAIAHLGSKDNPIIFCYGEDGQPWFRATQVCDVIGFLCTPKSLVRELPNNTVAVNDITGIMYINLPGLFHMIMRSKMPKAIEVREWLLSIITELFRHPEFVTELNGAAFNNPRFIQDPDISFRIFDPIRDALDNLNN